MSSNLSCLLVTGGAFPEEKLSDLLAPNFKIAEYDSASNLSAAFQFLLNSNFNLCLIGARYQSEYESFFRDMKKLGRDKTCAFVKVRSEDPKAPIDKPAALAAAGFCACISTELVEQDMKALRRALTKEVVRMHEEQRADDIPGYVELILKEVDKVARNRQRGVPEDYDKVIASLVRDMMRDESIHKDNFIEALATLAEKCEGFAMSKVDVPENVLQRQLPKLAKTQYSGKSSRVWHKLLSRYGKKNEETSE